MPLTASAAGAPADAESTSANQAEGAPERTIGEATTAGNENAAKPAIGSVLTLTVLKPVQFLAPDELTYDQLLDRYLGRLTTDKRLPEALAVLRA